MIKKLFFIFTWLDLTLLGSCEDVELLFVGDISFSGINYYLKKYGNCSYEESFSDIKHRLKADFKMGNLETPFGEVEKSPKERETEKPIQLLSDPSSVKALSFIGLDGVTLANNHFADYGEVAMRETLATLWKEKIKTSGISFGRHKYSDQEPIIIHKNGIKIGILSYCAVDDGCSDPRDKSFFWPALFNEKNAIKEIQSLREDVDFVIIYMHWGDEYSAVASDIQVDIAGVLQPYVNVIIGSHTHIPGEHFYVNDTLVVSSLGNFLFPMKHTRHTVFGVDAEGGSKDKLDGMKEMVTKFSNPSSKAEVVKLVINRNGLVKEKSVFAYFEIKMNRNGCFVVQTQKDKSPWKGICSRQDKHCSGKSSCNAINCVEEKPAGRRKPWKKTKKPLGKSSV